jgi:hypothetical protein
MPWTEDPKDRRAKRIRETQSGLAAALDGRLQQRLQAAPGSQDLLALRELALNALSNDSAMRTLHRGFVRPPKAATRFLPGKQEERILEVDALPGVVVHVLGPSRDENVIRDMDPPAGKGYLQFLNSCTDDGTAPLPFDDGWELTRAELRRFEHLRLKADEEESLRQRSKEMDLAVAVALDKAVNGTSLMLLFQVGETYLLFPGDAQWGTWQRVLADAEWRALLGKTAFYKIGHHGSHNATPKEFVEKVLPKEFWGAMASVRPVSTWKSIPKKELMEALKGKSRRVVRSDKVDDPLPTGLTKGDLYVEATVPVRA